MEYDALDEKTQYLYDFMQAYISRSDMPESGRALQLTRDFLVGDEWKKYGFKKDEARRASYFSHALSTAHTVLDLNIEMSPGEKDQTVAAAIAHVLWELIAFPDDGRELITVYGMAPAVYDIIRMITRNDPLTEEEQKLFYQRIREHKPALLIKLVDRGNLSAQLYGMSSWEAQDYVRETRTYFLPLCIYAKEHYRDLGKAVSILMEKMSGLTDVADILSHRYRDRESAITSEILELEEENARLRVMIAEFEDR